MSEFKTLQDQLDREHNACIDAVINKIKNHEDYGMRNNNDRVLSEIMAGIESPRRETEESGVCWSD